MAGDPAAHMSSDRKRSMATSLSARTWTGTGSLRTSDPASIVTDGRPPKVSGAPEPSSVEPSARRATCAAPMRSGFVPNRFVSATRTCVPPMVTRTICRSVWLATRGGFGNAGDAGAAGAPAGGGSAARSPVLHVPIQRGLPPACCWAIDGALVATSAAARIAAMAPARKRNADECFSDLMLASLGPRPPGVHDRFGCTLRP